MYIIIEYNEHNCDFSLILIVVRKKKIFCCHLGNYLFITCFSLKLKKFQNLFHLLFFFNTFSKDKG